MRKAYKYALVLGGALAPSLIPTSHWVGLSGARWIVGLPFTSAVIRQDYEGWVVNVKYAFLAVNVIVGLAVFWGAATLLVARTNPTGTNPTGSGNMSGS